MADPFNLQRFIDAQSKAFEAALAEIRSGEKRSHWMWFILPQLAGLGRSPMANLYAIRSLDEARAFLAHPLLGDRLRRSVAALMPWAGRRSAEEIFGPIDAVKLRSSLTLFELVEANGPFGRALDAFFHGARDTRTLTLLGRA